MDAAKFSDASWTSSSKVEGAISFVPRSSKTPINSHTNLWLRREFELSAVNAGILVFRFNHNHDAQTFLNGVEIVPTADWSDTDFLVFDDDAGRVSLKNGRNLLAVHCEDADGGEPVDVRIYVTTDTRAGPQKLIEEFGLMIGNEPERGQLYAGRASAYARRGSWREAVGDLDKAIKLDPADPLSWYQLAPLLLQTDDRSSYNRLRHEALASFAKTSDPVTAARIAYLALLVPETDEDLTVALKLADAAALAEYPDGYLCFRQLAKGLAEYRRGHFTNSVAWMDKALVTGGQKNLPGWGHEQERNRKSIAYLVESMAWFQMNNAAAARNALNQATVIVKQQLPSANAADIGRAWPEWLAVHLLLHEAHSLMP